MKQIKLTLSMNIGENNSMDKEQLELLLLAKELEEKLFFFTRKKGQEINKELEDHRKKVEDLTTYLEYKGQELANELLKQGEYAKLVKSLKEERKEL